MMFTHKLAFIGLLCFAALLGVGATDDSELAGRRSLLAARKTLRGSGPRRKPRPPRAQASATDGSHNASRAFGAVPEEANVVPVPRVAVCFAGQFPRRGRLDGPFANRFGNGVAYDAFVASSTQHDEDDSLGDGPGDRGDSVVEPVAVCGHLRRVGGFDRCRCSAEPYNGSAYLGQARDGLGAPFQLGIGLYPHRTVSFFHTLQRCARMVLQADDALQRGRGGRGNFSLGGVSVSHRINSSGGGGGGGYAAVLFTRLDVARSLWALHRPHRGGSPERLPPGSSGKGWWLRAGGGEVDLVAQRRGEANVEDRAFLGSPPAVLRLASLFDDLPRLWRAATASPAASSSSFSSSSFSSSGASSSVTSSSASVPTTEFASSIALKQASREDPTPESLLWRFLTADRGNSGAGVGLGAGLGRLRVAPVSGWVEITSFATHSEKYHEAFRDRLVKSLHADPAALGLRSCESLAALARHECLRGRAAQAAPRAAAARGAPRVALLGPASDERGGRGGAQASGAGGSRRSGGGSWSDDGGGVGEGEDAAASSGDASSGDGDGASIGAAGDAANARSALRMGLKAWPRPRTRRVCSDVACWDAVVAPSAA